MSSALEINDLVKVYASGVKAVDSLNLKIEKGEFFALLGPNGAGKTSLISILAGPSKLTSGQVKIFGLDIATHRQETKFLIGIVPQEITFDSFFTINETLILQSGYYGIRNNQAHIDHVLEKLGLADKKHANTRSLSGGMRRRLLIAKALMHKPKLLVLDEPTAGVDVELRHSLWEYVRELNASGTTILLTTHYLEEAESLCNRTAIINKGKIIAVDKTKKLITSLGDAKSMTLSFAKEIKTIPPALKDFKPEILNDHDLSIIFEPKKLTQVLNAIKDLDLQDLDLKGRRLEDVFIALTKRND